MADAASQALVRAYGRVRAARGLTVGVGYEPEGKHDMETGKKLFPAAIDWLALRIAPYSPR